MVLSDRTFHGETPVQLKQRWAPDSGECRHSQTGGVVSIVRGSPDVNVVLQIFGMPTSRFRLVLLVVVAFTCAGVFILLQPGSVGTFDWRSLGAKVTETKFTNAASRKWKSLLEDEVEDNWEFNDAWASTTTASSIQDFSTNQRSNKPLVPDLDAPGKLESLTNRFAQRSRLLAQKCLQPKHLKSALMNNAKVKLMKVAYGKLNYCPVPKIGTTFTRSIQRRHFLDNRAKRKRKKPEKSYFLVREPYSRLMSGYIGKIVTNQPWWKTFGKLIISKFRPDADKRRIQCGNGATFPEFVKYLIYSQEASRYINTHFQPIHQQCGICRWSYDFIGHLETLSDDMSFMLKSVDITGKDLNFDDSEGTIRGKCRDTVKRRPQISKCVDMCSMMGTVWWSFQARGLISKDIDLPIQGKRCDSVTGDEFAEMAMRAHNASLGNTNRSKQKREALVQLFTQVPLPDRLRLRELYLADFELFGYDSMPPDLFPEIR
ncbi:carbohydrate sulfotransferase [Elysia marginata]|uniref:Carbohydrate sulfotransferase n=1 Tax=Elysia marginata TaxID=1093978 RepID=A0AAV4G4R3_9GAST|nr:carbohydrate sulfotransferase [Elysia marginata]